MLMSLTLTVLFAKRLINCVDGCDLPLEFLASSMQSVKYVRICNGSDHSSSKSNEFGQYIMNFVWLEYFML